MRPLSETIAAVGKPIFLHSVREVPSPKAVVARFCHNGGDLDIAASDIVRVTINLQDGVPVHHDTGNVPPRSNIAAVGNVSVVPVHQRTQIAVRGKTDFLQLFLRELFLDGAVEGQFSCRALFNSHDSELQAAAMQIFVAATRGEPDNSLLLESGIHRIAARLLDRTSHELIQPTRGGLARAARRRVNDMITAATVQSYVRPIWRDLCSKPSFLPVASNLRAP